MNWSSFISSLPFFDGALITPTTGVTFITAYISSFRKKIKTILTTKLLTSLN